MDEFYRKLAEKSRGVRHYVSCCRYHKDLENWKDPGLLTEIAGFPKGILSDIAKETLDYIEETAPKADEYGWWLDFKWKLLAFFEMPDIFDSPIFPENPKQNIFRLWYFYYESKYLLLESILCGLNGFYSSSNALLRTFVEFNLLQLYYYRQINEDRSYETLERYFKTGIHPKQSTLVDKAFPKDNFSKPAKIRIKDMLESYSKNTNHPYLPYHSSSQHTGQFPSPSKIKSVYLCKKGLVFI